MLENLALLWSDPETRWLNLTNAALAVVCTICFGVVVLGLLKEVAVRLAARRETHAFPVAGLGMTMADGGEPVKPEKKTEANYYEAHDDGGWGSGVDRAG